MSFLRKRRGLGRMKAYKEGWSDGFNRRREAYTARVQGDEWPGILPYLAGAGAGTVYRLGIKAHSFRRRTR